MKIRPSVVKLNTAVGPSPPLVDASMPQVYRVPGSNSSRGNSWIVFRTTCITSVPSTVQNSVYDRRPGVSGGGLHVRVTATPVIVKVMSCGGSLGAAGRYT